MKPGDGFGVAAVGVLVAVSTGCGAAAHSQNGSGAAGRAIETTRGVAPRARTLAPPRPHAPPLRETQPVAPARPSQQAREIAARFFASYLHFLYGRAPARGVLYADAQLRSRLGRNKALITPAERATRPRILRITITAAGPPVSAIATVIFASGEMRYQLTVTLEPRQTSWIAVDVDS